MRALLLVLASTGQARRVHTTGILDREQHDLRKGHTIARSVSQDDLLQLHSGERFEAHIHSQVLASLLLASSPSAGWTTGCGHNAPGAIRCGDRARSQPSLLMGQVQRPATHSISEEELSKLHLRSLSTDGKQSRRSIVARAVAGLFGAAALLPSAPSQAADNAAIAACLFAKMPGTLARCITDPTCLSNVACIQTCVGRPDEGDCQVSCGDEFSNDVVGEFTRVAVSEKKCVPQRADDGSWPVPATSALVEEFDLKDVAGDWFISAGLNPAFDTFDCQLHKFANPEPGKIVGQLQWRVKDPIAGTNFVTRFTEQRFIQDPKVPGILYNHDNEFLHYQDDWYVLANRPGKYFLVYYRGSNDAWDGYGGAFLYTKTRTVPKKYVPELDAAMKKIGRSFYEFKLTNNVCKPQESKLEEAEADIKFVESRILTGAQVQSKKVFEGIETIERKVEDEVVFLEKIVAKEAQVIEQGLENDIRIAQNIEKGIEKEVTKDFIGFEKEVEKDLTGIERLFGFKKVGK